MCAQYLAFCGQSLMLAAFADRWTQTSNAGAGSFADSRFSV